MVDLTHFEAAPRLLALYLKSAPKRCPATFCRPCTSRYCQSDRLLTLTDRQFGSLPLRYSPAQAICDRVYSNVSFQGNTSSSNTTALDTLVERVGVRPDFAHSMIAVCRAANLPARMVSGMDYGADAALGPPDLHACVEVYPADACGARRWYMFNLSGTAVPMGFVRFCTGRDAADIAFATIFGNVNAAQPAISIGAVADSTGNLALPQHVSHALSTDGA